MAFIINTERREHSCATLCLDALGAAEDELKSVVIAHRESANRIAELSTAIQALRQYLGLRTEQTNSLSAIGLTDSCRFVIRESGIPLTASDVRDRLGQNGFPIKNHRNMLASIHSVLKRLVQSGFATTVQQDKKIYYMANATLAEGSNQTESKSLTQQLGESIIEARRRKNA